MGPSDRPASVRAGSRARPVLAAGPVRIGPRQVAGPTLAPARVIAHVASESAGSPIQTGSPGRPRADTLPRTPDLGSRSAPGSASRPSPRPVLPFQPAVAVGTSRPRTVVAGPAPSTPAQVGSVLSPVARSGRAVATDRPPSRDRPGFFHISDLRRPDSAPRADGRRAGTARMMHLPASTDTESTVYRHRPKTGSAGSLAHLSTAAESVVGQGRSPSPRRDNRDGPSSSEMRKSIGLGTHLPRAGTARAAVGPHARQHSTDSAGTIGTSGSADSAESRPGRRPGLGGLFVPPSGLASVPPVPDHQRRPSTDVSASTSLSPATSGPGSGPGSTAKSPPSSQPVFFAPSGSSPARRMVVAGAAESATEARRERKILDLEISNSSLLAINRQLEKEVRKQRSELRRFRRLTRAGRFTDFSNPPLVNGGEIPGLDIGELSESDDGLSPAASSSRLMSDEREVRTDLERHRQVLVDNERLNQGLTKCFWKTEELIKVGREALAYQVSVSDVPLTLVGPDGGGDVEADDDDEANGIDSVDETDDQAGHDDDDDDDKEDGDATEAQTDTDDHDRGRTAASRPYVAPRLASAASPVRTIDPSILDPDSTVVSEQDSVAAAVNAIRLWTNASPTRTAPPRYTSPSRIPVARRRSPSRSGRRPPVPNIALNDVEGVS